MRLEIDSRDPSARVVCVPSIVDWRMVCRIMAASFPAHVAVGYVDGSALFATTSGTRLIGSRQRPTKLVFFEPTLASIIMTTSMFPPGVPYVTIPMRALQAASAKDVAQCMIMIRQGLRVLTVTHHDPALPAWLVLSLDIGVLLAPRMAYWSLGDSYTHFVYSLMHDISVPPHAIVWTPHSV